jgi:hypothetical protein
VNLLVKKRAISMKILIVTPSFFPEVKPRSFRSTELAKQFSKLGHHVTVLCPRNKNRNLSGTLSDIKYIEYDRFESCIKLSNWVLNRMLEKFLNRLILYPEIKCFFEVKDKIQNLGQFDLCISLAWPFSIHWGVAWEKGRNPNFVKVWIADCGDPFTGNTFVKDPLIYFKIINKIALMKCQYIFIPYESLMNKFPLWSHSKIKVVPQAFDISNIKLKSKVSNKVPTFAFAGSFIRKYRDPENLFRFLSNLRIEFKFLCYVSNEDKIIYQRYANSHCIEFREKLPREELIFELSGVDFLVNIQNGNKNEYPSKLIDYSIAKRPVITINSFDKNLNRFALWLDGKIDGNDGYESVERFDIKRVVEDIILLCNCASRFYYINRWI